MTSSSKGGDAAASSKAPTAEASESAGSKPLTMRGRKRHKCMVCGNIARSRCPFFSCKGCCVKAGNSCHIHVLKPSPTGEGAQGPAASIPSQGPVISMSVRHPYDSLRLRTARPWGGLLTKKEAFFINSWRFRKLRAHTEGITASEDEAFDRYMHNVLLLEELFNASHADSCDGHASKGLLSSDKADGGIDVAIVLAGLRLRQRSSFKKRELHKQKLKRTIDRSLQKLQKGEELDESPENEDFYLNAFAARRELKGMRVQSADGKERVRRMEVFTILVEKLKAVENQEDFDLCLKMYEENFVNQKANASKHEGVAQVVCSEQWVDAGESAKPPTEKNNADLTFNTSFKSRLDSYGVMKQSWKVDSNSVDLYGCPFDVPLASLESL